MGMLAYRRPFLILLTFLIAITGIRVGWIMLLQPAAHPAINAGVLDLRGWTIPQDRVMTLNGEWEFHPSAFVPPGKGQSASPVSYIHVPGSWSDAFPDDRKSSFQYGTYRLRILADGHDGQAFSMRFSDLYNAAAVYVNGQFVGGNGRPSEQEATHEPWRIPLTVDVALVDGEAEVVVHASTHVSKGGMNRSVWFGTAEALSSKVELMRFLQLALSIIFLMHGLYAVMLYLLRAGNRGLLYFALLILCASLSVVTADERLLFRALPFTYEATATTTLLAYIGVVSFMPPLLNQILPGYGNGRAIRWFAIFSGSYATFTLLAPSPLTIPASDVLLPVVFIVGLWLSLATLYAAIRKGEDVIFLMVGSTSVAVNIGWTLADGRLASFEMPHYPFDLLMAVLAFAAFWFNRFFRATEQTKELATQLQKANRYKDDFLVNTSHELRNPLHGIMNITQSVLDDAAHPAHEAHRERLETQLAVARRMSLLLDDLLDVTRLRESTIRLQLRSLHVQSVVAGILEMLRIMLDGKPIRLTLDIPDHMPAVRADENRLIQILFNLLHNAIKFTDEGEIAIEARIAGGMARIAIKDTGIGMDEGTQRTIFHPYEQGDSERARASGGIGIGLSICKQLVELHEGTLSVRSVIGQGSEFAFTLPLAEQAKPSEEQALLSSMRLVAATAASDTAATSGSLSSAAPSGATGARILVVDDDSLNLKIIADVLGKDRYDIDTALHASEAMMKLEAGRYDLLISDVMMPRISGYALTRHVRERFTLFELPVLLLTARNRSEDIVIGLQAGANDYVTKPIDAWELRARVQALTQLRVSVEERLRLEGAWLHAQMQPHFIFNTLNSIAALAAMDVDRMQLLLEEFSNYLRTSIDFRNTDRVVSIDRELALVRSYLYIEKERFEDRISVVWDLDAPLDFQLPPLAIQTLVENAINHGILRRSGGGTVWLAIKQAEDGVSVTVKDNGVGIDEEGMTRLFQPASGGIGLRNTDDRLRQLYGQGLDVRSSPVEGTTVSFRIPHAD